MGKIAFVFAGQGAQSPGMGKDLYEAYPEARAVMDIAETIRPGTLKMCFEGDALALSQTLNTQPCLFLVDYVCAILARAAGAHPEACAGFSLGEVAASAFCGLLSFEEAFHLVIRRAEMMDECARQNPGAMYAVLKLSAAETSALCDKLPEAYPVNFNCPGQTVVACKEETEASLCEAVKKAGGRAMKLKVSGAFHSPFMDEAARGLSAYNEALCFKAPEIPLYANKTAAPYTKAAAGKLLADQIKSPVRFQETIENLRARGFDTFVEVGAGTTLSGLIRKISADARVLNVGDTQSLAALQKEFSCKTV